MKIGRQYLGKHVEVVWRDPVTDRVECHAVDLSDLPKGLAALSTWKERGILDDITDSVLRIRHSDGYDPGKDKPNEFSCTWVHEALVESITIKVDQVDTPVEDKPNVGS